MLTQPTHTSYWNPKQQFILCIDDEPTILEALYTQLIEKFEDEYDIECTESGQEALDLFNEIYNDNGRVALVVCDQLMPDLLGQYVLEHIHQRDKRVMKILLTGQAGLDAVTYAINHAGLHKYIEKPWDKYDLLLTVEHLLKHYQMSAELEFARHRYGMILQSMNNGVISLDFQGTITSFNQAAADLLGLSEADVLGKVYSEIFFEYPGNEEMNDVVIQAIGECLPQTYKEVTFLRKDGKRVPLGLMTTILKNSDNHEAGVLIVFHDLSQIRRYSSLKNMFSRYVAKQVVDQLAEADEITLHGEKREVTILFSDVRGFTLMAERLEPTEVVATLNAYFSCMIDVIYHYEGTLDKFLGDGIMCIFGAPIEQPDHAIRAAKTALAMKQALKEFNVRQLQHGKHTLEVGVSLNTGDAVVGNVGSEKRVEYTAIGDNVNLAARLQAIAKGGQILVSESTYQAIKNVAKVDKLTPVKIKGKVGEVQIYELRDLTS
jgi:adenylate cyclase